VTRFVLWLSLGLALTVVAGCENGSDGGAGAGDAIEVRFRVQPRTPLETVGLVGGLRISAACDRLRGEPVLAATVRTGIDDSRLISAFRSDQSRPAGYRFDLDDFDRDFGAYDFIGSGQTGVSGRIRYRPPGGEPILFRYRADSATRFCRLNGSARTVMPG
jgi:hypothetical protein